MSFLNPTGVTTLWSRMINYLTGAHVKTSVVSGATDVDGALTKLQTKTGTAALNTTANNLSGAVNELDSGLDAQSQRIDNLQAVAAYVEDGTKATKKTYTEGEFIVWKGSLYTVNSGGIPLDTAISGHVTAVTGGGFNTLFNGKASISLLDDFLTVYNADKSFQIGVNIVSNRMYVKNGSNEKYYTLQQYTS